MKRPGSNLLIPDSVLAKLAIPDLSGPCTISTVPRRGQPRYEQDKFRTIPKVFKPPRLSFPLLRHSLSTPSLKTLSDRCQSTLGEP